MNGPPVALAVTIEDYLSNPAYEHCEYVQGAVLEMNVGTGPHANAQLNCGSILRQYFLKKGGGKAFTELRYRLQIDGQVRFYQPDVAAVLGSTSVDFKFLDALRISLSKFGLRMIACTSCFARPKTISLAGRRLSG
jgi:Uma2 family endonuclease